MNVSEYYRGVLNEQLQRKLDALTDDFEMRAAAGKVTRSYGSTVATERTDVAAQAPGTLATEQAAEGKVDVAEPVEQQPVGS